MTHGTFIAKAYDVGTNYRGIVGLYGSYDYISPQTFRVASDCSRSKSMRRQRSFFKGCS